jgi:hypothetical protein
MSTELEDQLRAGMARVPAQVPPELAGTAYHRYRRRRAAVRAIAAACTAAAITGAVVVVVGLPRPSAPAPVTTAYVVDRVTEALDELSPDTIMFDRTTYDPASTVSAPQDSWAVPDRSRTEQFTMAGKIVMDQQTVLSHGNLTIVLVNYQQKAWSRWVTTFPGARPQAHPPVSPSCSNVKINVIIGSAPAMATDIRSALSCGKLRIAGTGSVDGVRAVKLTGTEGGITETFWVNTSTYLPVRLTTVRRIGPPVVQNDFEWLPPTAANQALLIAPIPRGFTQVPHSKIGTSFP